MNKKCEICIEMKHVMTKLHLIIKRENIFGSYSKIKKINFHSCQSFVCLGDTYFITHYLCFEIIK